jgi:hypothetical protein
MIMETSDKILLGLLLLAVMAFPVGVSLYLRTAYPEGGWRKVRVAVLVAVVAMLLPVALKLWVDWEFHNLERIIKHPLTLGSVIFVVMMWLLHRALKTPAEEAHDLH